MIAILVVFGAAYAAWIGLQALGAPSPEYADGPMPELPAELEVSVPRLPRVPSVDEASFVSATGLARATARVTAVLEGPLERDDLDVVVLDGTSRAEIARSPAVAEVVAFEEVPLGAHDVVVVERGESPRRSYSDRARVEVADTAGAACTLKTTTAKLTVLVGAGAKPPILELARPNDASWHAEAHARAASRSDGTLAIVFEGLGSGSYLLLVHGVEAREQPIPVTLTGKDEVVRLGFR